MNFHLIEGTNVFETKVVGSSFYLDNFLIICGPKAEEGHCKYIEAFLRLDNNNPHDSNAVSVLIGGYKVGHLSRKHAILHRLFVEGLNSTFCVCKAKIIGGWKKANGSEGHFGVELDLVYAEAEFTLNAVFNKGAKLLSLQPELVNRDTGYSAPVSQASNEALILN